MPEEASDIRFLTACAASECSRPSKTLGYARTDQVQYRDAQHLEGGAVTRYLMCLYAP